MSNKLVGACLDYKMPDLLTDKGAKVRGGRAKYVLMILCNSANDFGKGAYPGSRLIKKQTQYAIQTVTDCLNALRHNSYITLLGPSELQTNNYSINIEKIGVLPTSTGRTRNQGGGLVGGVLPTRTNLLRDRESEIFTALAELQGGGLNTADTSLVDKWCEFHTPEKILEAIALAKGRGARSSRYVDTILAGWAANGYPKTFEEKVKEAKRPERKRRKDSPAPPQPEPEWMAEMRARTEAMYANNGI